MTLKLAFEISQRTTKTMDRRYYKVRHEPFQMLSNFIL